MHSKREEMDGENTEYMQLRVWGVGLGASLCGSHRSSLPGKERSRVSLFQLAPILDLKFLKDGINSSLYYKNFSSFLLLTNRPCRP